MWIDDGHDDGRRSWLGCSREWRCIEFGCFQAEFLFRDFRDEQRRNPLHFCCRGRAHGRFNEIIRDARNAAAEFVDEVRGASVEYLLEIITCQPETMHQVTTELGCAQRLYRMALSNTLVQAGQLRFFQKLE